MSCREVRLYGPPPRKRGNWSPVCGVAVVTLEPEGRSKRGPTRPLVEPASVPGKARHPGVLSFGSGQS